MWFCPIVLMLTGKKQCKATLTIATSAFLFRDRVAFTLGTSTSGFDSVVCLTFGTKHTKCGWKRSLHRGSISLLASRLEVGSYLQLSRRFLSKWTKPKLTLFLALYFHVCYSGEKRACGRKKLIELYFSIFKNIRFPTPTTSPFTKHKVTHRRNALGAGKWKELKKENS